MKKKFAGAFLLGAMVLSLAACGSSTSTSESAAESGAVAGDTATEAAGNQTSQGGG